MGNDLKMRSPGLDARASRVHRLILRGLIAFCIVLMAGLAAYVLFRGESRLTATNDLPRGFELNLTDQFRIDPQVIDFQQTATIDLNLQRPCAIAMGPQDTIYVAGDQAIHIFSANGKSLGVIQLDSQPQCLVVGESEKSDLGRLVVGTPDGIRVLGVDHQILESWPLPAGNMLPTSVAVGDGQIFVADAGNRVVWRLNEQGEVLGQIGKADASRQIPGFVIPGSYFDIVAGSEGLLYCVNPGKLQVSTFSFDGDLGSSWGRAGSSLADFFGCCNPSHIARFTDGRFVTSERGIPRIKVYNPAGELESVVAGPEQLGISQHSLGDPRHGIHELVFDIAVDSRNRVLVLDPQTRSVRIFSPRSE